MLRRIFIFTCIYFILCTGTAFSDATQIGATSNNFLKILIPAKPAAMGEAYVALADDINALSYNPAGLAKSMVSEVSATHVIWFQDVLYDSINLLFPLDFGHLGFAVNYMHMSPMIRTSVAATPTGYSVDGEIQPFTLFGTVSYAKEFSEDFYIGANLSIINFAIDPEANPGSSVTMLAELGVVYDMSFVPGLSAGLALRNLGLPSKFIAEEFMQPMDIRLGVGYRQEYFTAEADVEIINDNDINFFLGASAKLFKVLSLRAGYKAGTINQPSLGAGVAYEGFSADYAFLPDWGESLGSTHRFTLSYAFGKPKMKISVKPAVFSPNGDRIYDYTITKPEMKNREKVDSLTLEIVDEARMPVRSAVLKNINRKIFWNGSDSMGMVSPDGAYYARFRALYNNGLEAESEFVKVEVDNTPPSVAVDANPKLIKPGKMTALVVPVTFSPQLFDIHGIGKWKLVIKTENGKVFKTFGGSGEPLDITWDGSDNTGINYTDTGTTYTYTLYAMDKVGNLGRSQTRKVKVLLREVVITLDADTLFERGKADVKISVYKDLQKIAEKIRNYKRKSVKIVGHTDNVPMRSGRYRNNQQLSEARAKAVAKFFVELFSLDPDLFTTVGMGDTMPVAANDTAEGRKKNRRVTIHLNASYWE